MLISMLQKLENMQHAIMKFSDTLHRVADLGGERELESTRPRPGFDFGTHKENTWFLSRWPFIRTQIEFSCSSSLLERRRFRKDLLLLLFSIIEKFENVPESFEKIFRS